MAQRRLDGSQKREKKVECEISDGMTQALSMHLLELGWENDYSFFGYTEMNIYLNGVYEIFRFNQSYLGTPWFDSCLMEVWDNKLEKSETRVGKIKGLVHIHESVTAVPRCMHVVVQLSTEPLSIKDMQQEFVCPYTLEEFLTVLPLHCVQSSLASCQYSSENERQNFCVLLHRKWAQYFSDNIVIEDREVN